MEPLIQHRDRTVRINQFHIIDNALAETYLSADEAAAQTAISVKDIDDFAVGKYVWFDPFGDNSEIVAMHASTAPTGGVITLAAGTAFAHKTGEKVYYVEFNQVEISHAATLAGSKSVLSTDALTAREKEHIYLDVSQTTGFYFARFKDSVASTLGSYSDGVAYDGWAADSVGYMIESAMRDISIDFSDIVTLRDCIKWINKGMRAVKGKIKKWPEHFIYDAIFGQVQRGDNIITLPSDIYDIETNRSIESIRIGSDNKLIYLDPSPFDAQMGKVKRTQIRTEVSAADTSVAVDNSYDFVDSGSVNFYISGTKYSFTYTAITRDDVSGASAAFTGVPASGDGSISVTIPVDTYIWQDETEGTPTFYTVRNSQVEIWPMVDADHDDQNVYGDYNTEATVVDSEIDTIDFHRFDMLESYLKWRMWAKAENDGILDKSNGFYTDYKEELNDAIRTMPVHKIKTAPNVNTMSRGRRGRFRRKPDIEPVYYT